MPFAARSAIVDAVDRLALNIDCNSSICYFNVIFLYTGECDMLTEQQNQRVRVLAQQYYEQLEEVALIDHRQTPEIRKAFRDKLFAEGFLEKSKPKGINERFANNFIIKAIAEGELTVGEVMAMDEAVTERFMNRAYVYQRLSTAQLKEMTEAGYQAACNRGVIRLLEAGKLDLGFLLTMNEEMLPLIRNPGVQSLLDNGVFISIEQLKVMSQAGCRAVCDAGVIGLLEAGKLDLGFLLTMHETMLPVICNPGVQRLLYKGALNTADLSELQGQLSSGQSITKAGLDLIEREFIHILVENRKVSLLEILTLPEKVKVVFADHKKCEEAKFLVDNNNPAEILKSLAASADPTATMQSLMHPQSAHAAASAVVPVVATMFAAAAGVGRAPAAPTPPKETSWRKTIGQWFGLSLS
jgi:hypothetical protein